MGSPKKNTPAADESENPISESGSGSERAVETIKRYEKSTAVKNSRLVSANSALQKSNILLEISNQAMIKKGRSEKAKLNMHIQSGKDLTKKLAQSEERGSNDARTSVAKLLAKDAELVLLNKELLTFTYISSHDMQEPLRNLQVLSSLILEKEEQNLSETGKDYFNRMQACARRIQNLIQDLIEYSDTNKVRFAPEPIDLNILLNQVKRELKDILKPARARIVSEKLDIISVVPFQFHKLFKELIINAVKFSRDGIIPRIIIRTEIIKNSRQTGMSPKKKYCHISFSDNGFGFDPLFRDRIFEVFQKLHGRQYKGSGIGLATCKKIIENHAGIITATGELGKGSTFDIYIPV